MSSQTIELGKEFRALVLKELRALAAWPAYREAQGLRSNNLRSAETRAACAALGYDLGAAWTRFQAMTGSEPTSAPVSANVAASKRDEDEASMAKGDEAPAKDAGSYEGRDVADVIAEILAPVSAHMTPHLTALVPGLLAPLVKEAVKGPRIVRQQVAIVAGASSPPVVNVRTRQTVHAAFDITGKKLAGASKWRNALNSMVGVCDYADAPRIDPDYIWNPKALAFMSSCDLQGMNLWLYGPAGTGKTESVEQYAARLHRPFFRLAITRNTEEVDLKGQYMPAKGGGVEWSDGLLTRALRTPNAVILIDEPSLLRPGALAVFQTLLDTRRLRLMTGESLEVAQGVFVCAADNTAGAGDDSGRYLETAPLNAAFMDRFALKLAYDYLPPAHEAIMVARRANVPLEAAKILVEYSGLTKSKARTAELTMAVTPRQLVGWARGVKAGLPSAEVFESAIINGAVAEDREVLLMLAATSLTSDHARIDGIVAGTWAPPAPDAAPAPAPSAIAGAFPNDQGPDTL